MVPKNFVDLGRYTVNHFRPEQIPWVCSHGPVVSKTKNSPRPQGKKKYQNCITPPPGVFQRLTHRESKQMIIALMYAAPEIRVTNKLVIIDSIATSNLTCSSFYSKIFCSSCKVLYRCINLYFIPIMLRLLNNMTLLLLCQLTKVITNSGHKTSYQNLVFHILYIKVNPIIISLYYKAINFFPYVNLVKILTFALILQSMLYK